MAKKIYISPVLVTHGSVEVLTQNQSQVENFDTEFSGRGIMSTPPSGGNSNGLEDHTFGG